MDCLRVLQLGNPNFFQDPRFVLSTWGIYLFHEKDPTECYRNLIRYDLTSFQDPLSARHDCLHMFSVDDEEGLPIFLNGNHGGRVWMP